MREEDSATSILLRTLVRILVIGVCVSLVYVVGHLMQRLIGSDYIVEEEVVIMEEDDDEPHKEKGNRGKVKAKRGKKVKAT